MPKYWKSAKKISAKFAAFIGMMRNIYILLAIGSFFISSTSVAQDKTLTELKSKSMSMKKLPGLDSGKIWTNGMVFSMNIGQGSQSNWAAGGDDFSFSLNSYLGMYSRYKKDRISWDNTLDLNYGIINTTSQGTRKNDDRIDATTKLGYSITPNVNLAGLANFHSQFSKGYNYKSDGTRELLSNFMSPGYLLLSLGFDYRPVEGLSIFVSPITSRWVFVMNDSLSLKGSYGVDPGEHVKNEIGAFGSVNYNKKFSENITYSGRLDLFSNYKHNPENIDVMMTNLFTFQVSKILSANLAIDMIYDDDVKLFGKNNDSPALQLKEVIGIGFTIKL